ncbi:MAG: hypothetical protein MZW92_17230 [Comamonadaceae bacterium]|nr:hypothetical protein [Comamonadaceae bacterium]
MVIVWLPQLQLLEATQLPQRLKAAADDRRQEGLAARAADRGARRRTRLRHAGQQRLRRQPPAHAGAAAARVPALAGRDTRPGRARRAPAGGTRGLTRPLGTARPRQTRPGVS